MLRRRIEIDGDAWRREVRAEKAASAASGIAELLLRHVARHRTRAAAEGLCMRLLYGLKTAPPFYAGLVK